MAETLTKVKTDVIVSLDAAKITGLLSAIDGTNLDNVSVGSDQVSRNNLALNVFEDSVRHNMDRLSLSQGWIDVFKDTDDVDSSTHTVYLTDYETGHDTERLNATNSAVVLPDGKEYLLSMWVNSTDDSTAQTALFFHDTGTRFEFGRDTSHNIFVHLRSTSGLNIGRVVTTSTFTSADGPTHYLFAIDMNTTTVNIYKNGVKQETTTVNPIINDTISTNPSGHQKFVSGVRQLSIGQLYVTNEYLDMDVAANMKKFYNNGPVDLGADGSKPTGTPAIIMLNGNHDNPHINGGSSGNFTKVGGPYADGGTVGVSYSSNTLSNSPAAVIDSYGKENADTDVALNAHNSNVQQMFVGQCVTFTTAVSITKLAFEMSDSTGSGTGDVWAVIMGTTGTVGSTAVGDGNILAKSDHLDGGTLTTSASIQTFTFAEPIVLPAGDYFLGMSGQDTGTSSVHWAEVRSDNSSPTHSGNLARYNNPTSAWVADSGADCIFYAYGTKNLDLITKGSDDIGNSPSVAPEKGHMEVLLTERPAGGTSTWSETLNNDETGFETWTIRQILSASNISTSGNRVRLTLEGHSTTGTKLDNVAIVERSGQTANGIEIPTEVLFGGSQGVDIPAGGSVASDWLDFTIDASKDYLAIFDVESSSSKDDLRGVLSVGDGNYAKYNTNSYNVAELSGSSFVSGRVLIINKLEVENKQTLNTDGDIIGQMSRDGGSTWDDVSLTRRETQVSGTSRNLLGGEVTFTGAAETNIVGRVKTANKDKITVHGISVNWS